MNTSTIDPPAQAARVPSTLGTHVIDDHAANPLFTPALGWEMALNQYGGTGENVVYQWLCAAHRSGVDPQGEITLEQLEDAARSLGFITPGIVSKRYLRASRIILTCIETNTGVKFVQRSREEITTKLCQCAAHDCMNKCYRPADMQWFNPFTGEDELAPATPADLPAEALEAAGLSPSEALEAADYLLLQRFDEVTQRHRRKARRSVQRLYTRFVESLHDYRHLPLPAGPISTAGDLIRAQAQAWCAAGLFNRWSVKEQCAALGISKNTRKRILRDAGIVEESETVSTEIRDSVRRAIDTGWQEDRRLPMTYEVIDGDGIICDQGKYRLAAVIQALAEDYRVKLHSLRRVYHVVPGPIPEAPAPAPQPNRPQAEVPLRKPRLAHHAWSGYSRRWVEGQLRLRYRLKFGSDARESATVRELIEAIIGQRLTPPT